ncbi:MAG: hypothetical protein WA941_07300 [Nitrososphaeraceae archaeon]
MEVQEDESFPGQPKSIYKARSSAKKQLKKMVESVEESESDFKANCEDYIKYLRENVDMHRRKIQKQD